MLKQMSAIGQATDTQEKAPPGMPRCVREEEEATLFVGPGPLSPVRKHQTALPCEGHPRLGPGVNPGQGGGVHGEGVIMQLAYIGGAGCSAIAIGKRGRAGGGS